MSSPGTSPLSITDVYNTIKAQEANFPIPRPSATFTVGTFNAFSGKFGYAVPKYYELDKDVYDPTERGGPLKPKPRPMKLAGGKITAENVVSVTLRFNISNRQGRDVVLSVPGYADVHAPAGQNFVTLDIGPVESVEFTLSCQGKEFTSELPLQIVRPLPLVGAGALTIAALPVAVVYAPPVDQNKKSTASWSFGNTTGTSTTVLSTRQSSTAVPDPQFNEPADLASAMQLISQVLKTSSKAGALSLGNTLGIVASAVALVPKIFGQKTVTSTVGTSSSNQKVLTLTFSSQQTVTTSAQSGGPGSGDLIYFLKNARICWFSNGGSLQLALLGWDGIASLTAGVLNSQGARSGLDPATIQALLALDPFVSGGAQAQLPQPRFKLLETAEVNGGDWKLTQSYTFTQEDTQTAIKSSSTVTDTKSGWLKSLGIGPAQTEVTTVASSLSTATRNTAGRSFTDSVDLFAGPAEIYSVEIYADVIFGTLAYRPVPTVAPAKSIRPVMGKTAVPVKLAGTVIDATQRPVPFAEVRLVNDGKKFVTRTDGNGQYMFRSASITPGKVVVRSGKMQKEAVFQGTPLTALDLKPVTGHRRIA